MQYHPLSKFSIKILYWSRISSLTISHNMNISLFQRGPEGSFRVTVILTRFLFCVENVGEEQLWTDLLLAHEPNALSIPSITELKPFQRLVFLVYCRPDKVISSMRRFVMEVLGDEFVDEEPLDVGKAYQESIAATPLIFLLGEEVDPLKYIFRYAEDAGFTGKKLRLVTMGLGEYFIPSAHFDSFNRDFSLNRDFLM